MADLADHAAATAAGYARIQIDRGAGKSPRFITRYEKPMTGEPGSSGGLWVHEAHSDASQAAADTAALTALNAVRRHRYGGSPGRASGDAVNSPGSRGGSLTIDLH